MALTFVLLSASFTAVLAQEEEEVVTTIGASPAETEAEEESGVGSKAIAAGIAVGLAAAAGAIGMAIAVAKSVESIARQPEASGKINSTMMLGLVFIETAILYALIIAILVIFVL
ncbi:MAG: ATP synthase F0 subunit C [Clostridia bacterium]|nr:ATP synthase F0 subunit C [Clostridia bacterium]